MVALFPDLAFPGARLNVRVTPKAARNLVKLEDGLLRVSVTTVPQGGKANAAVVKLLSKALGIPKSKLMLVRGDTARDKVFEVLD